MKNHNRMNRMNTISTSTDTSEEVARDELVSRNPVFMSELRAAKEKVEGKDGKRAIRDLYRRWGIVSFTAKGSPRYYEAEHDRDGADIKKSDWVFVVPPNLTKKEVERIFKSFLQFYPSEDTGKRFNKESFEHRLKIFDKHIAGISLIKIAKDLHSTPDTVRKALKTIEDQINSIQPVKGK